MAASITQSKGTADTLNTTTIAFTLTSTPANGALVLVALKATGAITVSSISGMCASWTLGKANTVSGSNGTVAIYYGYSNATSNSATCTFSGKSTNKGAICYELGGMAASSPLGNTGLANNTANATVQSGTLSAGSTDFVFAAIATGTDGQVSGPINGFTQDVTLAGTVRLLGASKIETSAETASTEWTLGAAANSAGVAAAFLAASFSAALFRKPTYTDIILKPLTVVASGQVPSNKT